VNGAELLAGLADTITAGELLEGMSTREIMDEYGVSRAAAWRARTGRTRSPKFAQGDEYRNQMAAEAFRRRAARQIRVGRVKVSYVGTGRAEGWRTIPAVDLEDPEEIAGLIEDGEYDQAADALSAQIMADYGAGDGEAVYLEVADWPPELLED
jgi:hypothetical protein